MELISIIIPIYNTEKFLDKCIESVVNQTYKKLEIILVDDGSTDNSGNMCDEWAERDARIKVFHKPNGGLMNAWKYGVLHSAGRYIGFIDSDDWVDENMYQRLLDVALENDSHLVVCGLSFNFKGEKTPCKMSIGCGHYAYKDIQEKIYPIISLVFSVIFTIIYYIFMYSFYFI